MQPLTRGAVLRAAAALLLGGLVAAVGTTMHRSVEPWGLVLSLALVLGSAVTVRAWSGFSALIGFAGGLFLVVQLLSQPGPGGDVLVTAQGLLGWTWVIGAAVATGLAAFAPRAWFRDVRPSTPPAPPAP
ncbi:hypothetical protein [Cellulomonas cellasea]|uniref:Uncharacterized protein n=1 Tax=Cellulomonas cellasea TaxID=43670 RepID=A0A7W4YC90_9CELL|nr:hypothetical protein [Cellulomonas cellasea]MBB2923874.1 hypothetical protein [Cellulomonas cellasea]